MDTKNWKVSHYYSNPRNNKVLSFSTKNDAVEEARKMHSDEPNGGTSTIENTVTGQYGTRDWNMKNIEWKK